ncbi:MAG: Crp/Fnr family transcriptional regulator [Salibacteraceae bacterium]
MSQFLTEYYQHSQLSASEIAELSSFHQLTQVKKGQALQHIGRRAKAYWLIQSGVLRSYVMTPEGEEMTTNFYVTGEIALDFTGFFLHKSSLEGIEALSDAEVWRVEKPDFEAFMKQSSAFGKWGKNWMVCSLIARQQFYLSHHTHTAKERYEQLRQERPQVNRLAHLKYIASYIGVTDSTLSRLRRN